MTRRVIVVSAVAVLLCVAGAAWAASGPPAEKLPEAAPNTGFLGEIVSHDYDVIVNDDAIATVTQQVASWDVDGDGLHDFFAYTYTVKNKKSGTLIVE